MTREVVQVASRNAKLAWRGIPTVLWTDDENIIINKAKLNIKKDRL